MKYILLILLLLFPLGQLGHLPLSGNEITLQINDLAVGLVSLLYISLNFSKIKKLLLTDPLSLPLAIWIFLMLLSLVVNAADYNQRQLLASFLYQLRFVLYASLYYLFKNEFSSKNDIVYKLLNSAVLVVAILGLLQYVFLPNVSFLKAFDWDDHYYRLVSTFLDPGFTGIFLLLGLILLYFRRRDHLDLGSLALEYLSLALTYSRATFISFLAAAAAISCFRKSFLPIVFATLLLLLTVILLPTSSGEGTKLSRENSVLARIHNWQLSLSIWQRKPLLGVGFNSYRYQGQLSAEGIKNSHAGSSDSSLLLVLATTGIVGLTVYLSLLLAMWKHSGVIFKVSLLTVILHSFFNNTLFYPWVMEWLWILLAIRG